MFDIFVGHSNHLQPIAFHAVLEGIEYDPARKPLYFELTFDRLRPVQLIVEAELTREQYQRINHRLQGGQSLNDIRLVGRLALNVPMAEIVAVVEALGVSHLERGGLRPRLQCSLGSVRLGQVPGVAIMAPAQVVHYFPEPPPEVLGLSRLTSKNGAMEGEWDLNPAPGEYIKTSYGRASLCVAERRSPSTVNHHPGTHIAPVVALFHEVEPYQEQNARAVWAEIEAVARSAELCLSLALRSPMRWAVREVAGAAFATLVSERVLRRVDAPQVSTGFPLFESLPNGNRFIEKMIEARRDKRFGGIERAVEFLSGAWTAPTKELKFTLTFFAVEAFRNDFAKSLKMEHWLPAKKHKPFLERMRAAIAAALSELGITEVPPAGKELDLTRNTFIEMLREMQRTIRVPVEDVYPQFQEATPPSVKLRNTLFHAGLFSLPSLAGVEFDLELHRLMCVTERLLLNALGPEVLSVSRAREPFNVTYYIGVPAKRAFLFGFDDPPS